MGEPAPCFVIPLPHWAFGNIHRELGFVEGWASQEYTSWGTSEDAGVREGASSWWGEVGEDFLSV